MNKQSYKITGLVILCACSDGKLREVRLSPDGAITLKRTLLHVSHQKIKLYGGALRVVPDEEPRIARFFRKFNLRRSAKSADHQTA